METKEDKTLQFSEKARELKFDFNELIAEYREDLWKYCRYLTGSPWDGEDLYQETLIKAFGAFYQRWHPTNPKSYIYRIATNTWIDQCRKEKRQIGYLEEEHEPVQEFIDTLHLEDALEQLFSLFTPRQTAAFLLMDVFQFTADEVAGIVKTTPGAVYATVRRVRNKLQDSPKDEKKKYFVSQKRSPGEEKVIQTYLKALNQGNIDDMLSLISDYAVNEADMGFQEFSKDEMRKGSVQHGLPGFRAEEKILWGKPVIVVFASSADGPQIHDIQYQEVENGKIVAHRSFFFRKELIFAASEELGIPPQLDKPPVKW
ncbi:RNA polymerase sigma factor [Pseudalkalibacillus caeni]|uniref:RNA polymerase sigma factor n=1 Tax=Exobacillus caeni TaxID=2574798 RepID=A0A5R9F066_9BACL|nr:RNA polymerase sigma factor [Pseudalkalibacillus caeni]TLS36907.1 RNA polymerase sigma factor [Pseudalkalibacillus caeni]